MPRTFRALCMIVAATAMLTGGVAHAHKLKLFATGEGQEISGYAYFPGGGRAQELTVEALAPDGSSIGQATTNAEGEFTIAAKYRCDHTLVTQTVDGHKASFLVEAIELAEDLPAFGAAPADDGPPAAEADSPSPAAAPAEPSPPSVTDDQLLAAVDRAVNKQVGRLREQLEGYEERTRLRDILGGIGYIMGLGGIAFYFLGVRRREAGGA